MFKIFNNFLLSAVAVLILFSYGLYQNQQRKHQQLIALQRQNQQQQAQLMQLQNMHKQAQIAAANLEQIRNQQQKLIINHQIKLQELANENNHLKNWLDTAIPADIVQLYQQTRPQAANN